MNRVQIKPFIESAIQNYFQNKPNRLNLTNYHVLNEIFPRQRQARSLIGGLETSFGKNLWQPLAYAIARNGGFHTEAADRFNTIFGVPDIPRDAERKLNRWLKERQKNIKQPDFADFVALDDYILDLQSIAVRHPAPPNKVGKGEAINLWVKKRNVNYIFNISTNKLNTGGGVRCNHNLMKWYLYSRFHRPREKFVFKIAFPFNPYPDKDFWGKEKNKISPLMPREDAVVQDEFWSFLSGRDDTWDEILAAFKSLGIPYGQRFKRKFG